MRGPPVLPRGNWVPVRHIRYVNIKGKKVLFINVMANVVTCCRIVVIVPCMT